MSNIKKYLAIIIIAALAISINLAIAQDNDNDNGAQPQNESMNNSELQSGLQSLTQGISKMLQGKAMIQDADNAGSEELKNSRKIVGNDMMNEGNQMIGNSLDQISRGKDMLMQSANNSTATSSATSTDMSNG